MPNPHGNRGIRGLAVPQLKGVVRFVQPFPNDRSEARQRGQPSTKIALQDLFTQDDTDFFSRTLLMSRKKHNPFTNIESLKRERPV